MFPCAVAEIHHSEEEQPAQIRSCRVLDAGSEHQDVAARERVLATQRAERHIAFEYMDRHRSICVMRW